MDRPARPNILSNIYQSADKAFIGISILHMNFRSSNRLRNPYRPGFSEKEVKRGLVTASSEGSRVHSFHRALYNSSLHLVLIVGRPFTRRVIMGSPFAVHSEPAVP